MRSLCRCLILFALLSSVSAEHSKLSKEVDFDRSLDAVSFEQLDLSGVMLEFRSCSSHSGDFQDSAVFERNLKYLFRHGLNRSRLFVAPEPQVVADQIAAIWSRHRQLDLLLGRAATVAAKPESRREMELLIQDVGSAARELRRKFEAYFVEPSDCIYTLEIPLGEDPSPYLASFLVQARVINDQLARRLGGYFFDPSPGAVTLSEFGESSITTLTQALERLSELVGRKLGELR